MLPTWRIMPDSPRRDMVKVSMAPYLLVSWGIMLLGWILLLGGIASLQEECGSGGIIPLGGYMGPEPSCSKLYAYTWFICWYIFLVVLLAPIIVVKNLVGTCRASLLGILATMTMLTGDLSNTFLTATYTDFSSTFLSRCRATSGGAIICSMASYLMIIFAGFVDEDAEKSEKSGAPTTQSATRGGYYMGDDAREPNQPGSEYTAMS